MKIESLDILDYKEEKGASYKFSNGVNLIVSNGNGVGKSSLLKSIYYTLGFSIRQFPDKWNEKNKIYRLKIKLNNGVEHVIIRHGDIYKVEGDIPLNSKEYSKWLQKVLKTDMQLPHKQTKKLYPSYSSALILPFYIDQDDSWDGALYRGVSDALGQYSNIPKGIFEYLFSISDMRIQELISEIGIINKQLRENEDTIDSVNRVLENYIKQISDIPEIIDIDREKIKKEIDYYMNMVQEFSKEYSDNKINLIKKRGAIDLLQSDYEELSQLLKMNKKRNKDISIECKLCHSKLTQEQSLIRLQLKNNEFEIIALKDKLFKDIETQQRNILELQGKQDKTLHKIEAINSRLKKSNELLTIEQYIDARAKTIAVKEIEKNIEFELMKKINNERKKKEITAEKNKLIKEKKLLKEELLNEYDKFKNEIYTTLKIDAHDEVGFLDFRTLQGSGMNKNTKYLGNYLIYFMLMNKYGYYSMPYCMDSFIKNEITSSTAEKLFSAIEEYFLSSDNQVFFSIVSENLKFLKADDKYNHIHIEEHLLNKDSYELLKSSF